MIWKENEPKSQHDQVYPELRAIFYQANREKAEQTAAAFFAKYGNIYPTATDCLQRDLDACLTFYQFPESHWRYIRTSNAIERLFQEVKKRSHKMAAAFRNENSCLLLFYADSEESLCLLRLPLNPRFYTTLDILPIQSPEQFGDLFWATACQRKADLYEEVVFVCDGAAWIWKLIERHFPQAVQIVDWYHASEYLPPIAEVAFGRDTPEYLAWLQQARTLLWEGQIDDLIHECQSLESIPAAQTAVHHAVSYFTNNQKHMDYARFRQQGYFIGSGTVESAGKQIAALRLKRAGARWPQNGAVATAKARAAWLSNQWDDLAARRAMLPIAT